MRTLDATQFRQLAHILKHAIANKNIIMQGVAPLRLHPGWPTVIKQLCADMGKDDSRYCPGTTMSNPQTSTELEERLLELSSEANGFSVLTQGVI